MPHLIWASPSAFPYLTYSPLIACDFRDWGYQVEDISEDDDRIRQIQMRGETSFSQWRIRPPLNELWLRQWQRRYGRSMNQTGNADGNDDHNEEVAESSESVPKSPRTALSLAFLPCTVALGSLGALASHALPGSSVPSQLGRRASDRELSARRRRHVEFIVPDTSSDSATPGSFPERHTKKSVERSPMTTENERRANVDSLPSGAKNRTQSSGIHSNGPDRDTRDQECHESMANGSQPQRSSVNATGDSPALSRNTRHRSDRTGTSDDNEVALVSSAEVLLREILRSDRDARAQANLGHRGLSSHIIADDEEPSYQPETHCNSPRPGSPDNMAEEAERFRQLMQSIDHTVSKEDIDDAVRTVYLRGNSYQGYVQDESGTHHS